MALTIEQADEKIAAFRQQVSDAETQRQALEGQLTRSFLDGGGDSATVEAQLAALPSRITALNAAIEVVLTQRREAERVVAAEEYERVTFETIVAEHERREAELEVKRVEGLLEAAKRAADERNHQARLASSAHMSHQKKAKGIGVSDDALAQAGRKAVERTRERGIDLTKEKA